MLIDPENPVVKLCVAGMQAEAEDRFADARTLFEQAWAVRHDHLDACIAAHYLARHQHTPEHRLHWNQEALRYADAVASQQEASEQIAAFYPSLYLNLGRSHEDLGDYTTARDYYQLADEKVKLLADEYGDIVRKGIAAGLQRTLK
jgi:tetratricopeptide (TPR) repeat protein